MKLYMEKMSNDISPSTVKSVLRMCSTVGKNGWDNHIVSLHSSARLTQLLRYFSLINVLVSPLQKLKHGFTFR